MNNQITNSVSGNSRDTIADYWWNTVHEHNKKPKIIKTTDLKSVTKIRVGVDNTPKRKFKTKQQREHEAKLRKNIELSKNIRFLN